jgi:hypothetical protein
MKNKEQPSNFWFGFALGTIAAVGSSYLLGTKNGRDLTKKLLDLTENLEENLNLIKTELVKEMEKHPGAHTETHTTSLHSEAQTHIPEQRPKPLAEILNKINSLTPHLNSEPKKFIMK